MCLEVLLLDDGFSLLGSQMVLEVNYLLGGELDDLFLLGNFVVVFERLPQDVGGIGTGLDGEEGIVQDFLLFIVEVIVQQKFVVSEYLMVVRDFLHFLSEFLVNFQPLAYFLQNLALVWEGELIIVLEQGL